MFCRFNWLHSFKPWSDPFETDVRKSTYFFVDKNLQETAKSDKQIIQERKCSRCNLVETRHVRWGSVGD